MSKAQESVNALIPEGYVGAVSNLALQEALDAVLEETTDVEPNYYVFCDAALGDDGNVGSKTSPFATPQKAHDYLVETYGINANKTIVLLGNNFLESLIVRSRNVTLMGVDIGRSTDVDGRKRNPVLFSSTDPALILTNMTEDGLEAFRVAGGISYTKGPFAYTGASPLGRDRVTDLDHANRSYFNFKAINVSFYSTGASVRWGGDYGVASICTDTTGNPGIIFMGGMTFENCGFNSKLFLRSNSTILSDAIFNDCEFNAEIIIFNTHIKTGRLCAFELPGTDEFLQIHDVTDGVQPGTTANDVFLPDTMKGSFVVESDSNLDVTFTNSCAIYGDFVVSGPVEIRGTFASFIDAVDESAPPVVARDANFNVTTFGTGQIRLGYVQFRSLTNDGDAAFTIESGTIRQDVDLNDGVCGFNNLTIKGDLTVGADATIDFSNVVVLGNVTFIAGATVTGWKGGYYLGSLTETAAELGGAAAASILNV